MVEGTIKKLFIMVQKFQAKNAPQPFDCTQNNPKPLQQSFERCNQNVKNTY
jgi:hypothetical protein